MPPKVQPLPSHFHPVHAESLDVVAAMPELTETQLELLDQLRRGGEAVVTGAKRKTVEALNFSTLRGEPNRADARLIYQSARQPLGWRADCRVFQRVTSASHPRSSWRKEPAPLTRVDLDL